MEYLLIQYLVINILILSMYLYININYYDDITIRNIVFDSIVLILIGIPIVLYYIIKIGIDNEK